MRGNEGTFMRGRESVLVDGMPSRREMWRELFRLSWPCAVELFLSSMIGVVTVALVAKLGAVATNATSITNQPIMIPNVILQAFCVGGTAVVARSLGQRDQAAARTACEQTLLLSIVFSVLATVLMYFLGGLFIGWMGATPDYYDMAVYYMKYCAVGVFFQSISTAVAALLRGAGKTRLSMYFNIVSNVVNVLLGMLLINGFGPIPALGITGAGIAQLAAKIVGCAMALFILFRSHDLPIRPDLAKLFRPRIDVMRRICRVGTSSALEQLALRVGLLLFTTYIVHLGTAEYAAHNIAGSIHSYVVNFGQAISVALVSLVGQNLGAKRPDIAERYFSEALKMCWLVSAILMVPLLLIPQYIAMIFTREAAVIEDIVVALRILAGFVAPQIIQIAVCGGLRGGGDTKWPLISTMIGVLGMRMVLGYFFIVVFQWGLAGAWFCWLLDQTTRAVIIYFRFRGGKWKTVKV
ncbi:MAG: MATE family efflux transporter [Ruminococcaceae bacterium]|nr:MATE family efflux transporter [Oscillospiraceae bacterium]